MGTSGLRLWCVGRVGLDFPWGVTLVAGTAPRRNEVPLFPPLLSGALLDGVVEQVAWSSRSSSDLARLVFRVSLTVAAIRGSAKGQGEMDDLERGLWYGGGGSIIVSRFFLMGCDGSGSKIAQGHP